MEVGVGLMGRKREADECNSFLGMMVLMVLGLAMFVEWGWFPH